MKRTLLLVALLFGALAAYSSPVTLQLVSFDGPFVNGIPTYPYTLQYNGVAPFWGICDDYNHDGAPGDVWLANLTNLGTGNLTYLRFASAGLLAYQEAAWILLQTEVTSAPLWPDMNFAVWHIFDPSVPITPKAQLWVSAAQFQSRRKFPNVDFSNVMIGTPVEKDAPPTGDQEFMWIIQPTNVPEPGSMVLLGTGALTAVSALRKKWKR